MDKLNISVIIGSTREGRFSEKPAKWVFEELKKNPDIEAELLDLRDFPMPFYDSVKTPKAAHGDYTNEVAMAWAAKIKKADGFIVVTPEYNHGYPAILKNALDWIYLEWNKKPIGFVSYGSAGGARSIEQLRQVAVELEMTPLRNSINIFWATYMEIVKASDPSKIFESMKPSLDIVVDELLWHAKILKSARNS